MSEWSAGSEVDDGSSSVAGATDAVSGAVYDICDGSGAYTEDVVSSVSSK